MNNDLMNPNGGQLVTRPSDANVSLLEIQRDWKRFPGIGTYSRDVAINEMTKIVSQAYILKGNNADVTTIQFISTTLVDELQSDLDGWKTKNLSFAAIARIIRRAVLTEDMYLSASGFYRVIMNYVKGEGQDISDQIRKERHDAELEEIRNSPVYQKLQAEAAALARKFKSNR